MRMYEVIFEIRAQHTNQYVFYIYIYWGGRVVKALHVVAGVRLFLPVELTYPLGKVSWCQPTHVGPTSLTPSQEFVLVSYCCTLIEA